MSDAKPTIFEFELLPDHKLRLLDTGPEDRGMFDCDICLWPRSFRKDTSAALASWRQGWQRKHYEIQLCASCARKWGLLW